MYRYASRAEMLAIAGELTLTERASLRKSVASRSPAAAAFLSHSTKDEDLVTPAVQVLENHGAKVYTDKQDPALPPYTSEKTADILRDRIRQANRFVLLASINSKESRWVPWELGIADGTKNINRIAVFPIGEQRNERGWANWEYLGLYERIVFGDLKGYSKPVWMVIDEGKNVATELSKWLRPPLGF